MCDDYFYKKRKLHSEEFHRLRNNFINSDILNKNTINKFNEDKLVFKDMININITFNVENIQQLTQKTNQLNKLNDFISISIKLSSEFQNNKYFEILNNNISIVIINIINHFNCKNDSIINYDIKPKFNWKFIYSNRITNENYINKIPEVFKLNEMKKINQIINILNNYSNKNCIFYNLYIDILNDFIDFIEQD